MEWSWQTVMILIGLLGLAVIIYDGYRKMKRARAEALGLNVASSDAGTETVAEKQAEPEIFNPELPGKARVIKPADPNYKPARRPDWAEQKAAAPKPEPKPAAKQKQEPGFSALGDDITTEAEPVIPQSPLIPTARPVNLDEKVPVLLDVEELGSGDEGVVSPSRAVKTPEPEVTAEKQSSTKPAASAPQPEMQAKAETPKKSHTFIIPDDDEDEDFPEVEDPAHINDPHLEEEVEQMPPDPVIPPVNYASPDAEKLSERTDPQVVLVIHTVARDPEGFDGEKILYLFNSCDLRYGEKNIFHRFEDPDGRGRIQFSVAQMRNPGTFEPEDMPEDRYSGLSFFMSLPGARKPLEAYEAMSEMALVISRNLGADVLDGTHSAMTPQTMEHDRQQILDYERQQQLAAKKQRR